MPIDDLTAENTRMRINQIGLESARAPAFGYLDELRSVRYDWHQHAYHQLIYALRGMMHVEVGQRRFVLPPQRAAWISAGTEHRTTLLDAECGSVFFHPCLVAWPIEPIRIIAAPPLLREMVKEAARWQPQDRTIDDFRRTFFDTLTCFCREWLEEEMPFWLPNSSDPQLARGIDHTLRNLSHANSEGASAAAGMSPRTFRRRFHREMGMSWRGFVLKARLLNAMELLARPGAGVAEVANKVGFESPGAFSKAFTQFTSQTPSEFRLASRGR